MKKIPNFLLCTNILYEIMVDNFLMTFLIKNLNFNIKKQQISIFRQTVNMVNFICSFETNSHFDNNLKQL